MLVALLYGPWLLVTDVAWAGERYTADRDLREALAEHRGTSLLAVDTDALARRSSVCRRSRAHRSRPASAGGWRRPSSSASAAFLWVTPDWRYLGAADGTIFAREPRASEPDAALTELPRIGDHRSSAGLLSVGDVIPEPLLRTALDVAALDPALLGSDEARLAVQLDDEFGFRLFATEQTWEVALGVYGIDPRETSGEADERLERQITAVRTLFATHAEDEVGWVDVRNPGKVYFRAKG